MNEIDTVNPETTKPKFMLVHGIHKGTLMSRDTGQQEFDSMEACEEYLDQQEAFYRSIGYMIWFAYVIDPDGKRTSIHPGNSYR